jgi:hypothetical protein
MLLDGRGGGGGGERGTSVRASAGDDKGETGQDQTDTDPDGRIPS